MKTLLALAALTFTLKAYAAAAPGADSQVVESQPSPATAAPSEQSISAPFKLVAPSVGNYTLKAGIKSQNTTGRMYDLNNPNGKRYNLKNEYYLGFVHSSGFGAYGQAVTSGPMAAGTGRTAVGAGDPSVTLLHPDYFRGQSLTVAGQFRAYFPVSDRSVTQNIHQFAYYLMETYKMPRMWSMFNQTVPRYFAQSVTKDTDTTYYVEDLTTLSKQVASTWALGVSQWTQVETHSATPTGVAVDAGVFARWTPIANIWIEPRLLTPVYIKNAVYDQSTSVALAGSRAELYAQLTL